MGYGICRVRVKGRNRMLQVPSRPRFFLAERGPDPHMGLTGGRTDQAGVCEKSENRPPVDRFDVRAI